ncbi:MAG: glycosyl hydrolase [Rubrivivax sp.]
MKALRRLLGTALLATTTVAGAAEPLFSVYQDLSLAGAPPPASTFDLHHWSFATGDCGSEIWAGEPAQALAAARRNQQRYMLATGGAKGIFTCDSDAGMERFVARFDSPLLAGLDFDIEGPQTEAQIDSLVQRVAALAAKRPQLLLYFTLATHAGSDNNRASLTRTGETVLAALQRHRLDRAIVNLMVMDYGPASDAVCVLRRADGRCDMGASGLQAARNVAAKYGLPLSRIALTAMIGVNDVVENVMTLADARRMAGDARAFGMAGLAYWSLDRDKPCKATEARADCHSLPEGAPLGFAHEFAEGLGRR